MKIQTVLGLCLSGSLLLAGPPALAEKPANPGMKVQVDKETGQVRKANAAEAAAMDDEKQRQLAADWWDATVPGSDADGVVHMANGAKMKRMNVESLEAFAIKLDDEGKPVALHTDADGDNLDTDAEAKEVTHDDH